MGRDVRDLDVGEPKPLHRPRFVHEKGVVGRDNLVVASGVGAPVLRGLDNVILVIDLDVGVLEPVVESQLVEHPLALFLLLP